MAPGLLDTRSGLGSWPPQALSTQATGLGHMQGSNQSSNQSQAGHFYRDPGVPADRLAPSHFRGSGGTRTRASTMLTLGSGPAEHHTVSPCAALISPPRSLPELTMKTMDTKLVK